LIGARFVVGDDQVGLGIGGDASKTVEGERSPDFEPPVADREHSSADDLHLG
jgi:hypothetical protein